MKPVMIMPVTEIDRANMIFERIRYTGQPEQARRDAPSKEQEARVGQEAPQCEQERPRQEETPEMCIRDRDEKARAMGLRLLESCQQMNVYGPVWTDGMWQEIYKAGELGIPVLTDQKTIGRTPPARHPKRKER